MMRRDPRSMCLLGVCGLLSCVPTCGALPAGTDIHTWSHVWQTDELSNMYLGGEGPICFPCQHMLFNWRGDCLWLAPYKQMQWRLWYNSVSGFLWLVSSQVKYSCTNQMGCDGLMGQFRHMVHGRTHGFASSFLPSYYGLWKIIIRTKQVS